MITRPKSTKLMKRNLSAIQLERINNINSLKNTQNHSPKISTNKFRSFFMEQKLFSVLDINEKVTYSKGPSLPKQYNRLTSEELKKMFYKGNTETHKLAKKIQFNSMKNILFEKMNLSSTPPQQKSKKNFKEKFTKKFQEISKTSEENGETNSNIKKIKLKLKNKNNKFTENEIKILKKENIIKQRPQTCKANRQSFKRIFAFREEEKKDAEKTYIKRDAWKPLNFEAYEDMYNNKTDLSNRMQENPFYIKLPHQSMKEIKEKMHRSDVFFVNNIEQSDLEKHMRETRIEKYNKYFESDIFNIKNDDISIKKIGEKYLFNAPNSNKYTSSRESKSGWENKSSKNISTNFSSKKYNILVPSRKNDLLTKDDIYKLLNQKNCSNPLHKQKGISKYFDLAKNSSSNFGKEYSKCFVSNPNCFKKVPEYCSSFGDLYLQYKDLCDEPFYKKKQYK